MQHNTIPHNRHTYIYINNTTLHHTTHIYIHTHRSTQHHSTHIYIHTYTPHHTTPHHATPHHCTEHHIMLPKQTQTHHYLFIHKNINILPTNCIIASLISFCKYNINFYLSNRLIDVSLVNY